MPRLKGPTIQVFTNQQVAALCDAVIDCQEHNAIAIEVTVNGTNPSATVSVEGAPAPGGPYVALSDPGASQSAVTSNQLFDVMVGPPFAKIRLADVTGTYGAGLGYSIRATPYVAPGPTSVRATIA